MASKHAMRNRLFHSPLQMVESGKMFNRKIFQKSRKFSVKKIKSLSFITALQIQNKDLSGWCVLFE